MPVFPLTAVMEYLRPQHRLLAADQRAIECILITEMMTIHCAPDRVEPEAFVLTCPAITMLPALLT